MHILYIEDIAQNAELVALTVELIQGVEIDIAETGELGFFKFEQRTPALVMLDINLPDTNGKLLCKMMKAKNPDVPIVALSANALKQEIEDAMEYGFDRYLTKPVNISELIAIVEAVRDGGALPT